jgi:hypothetical protein
MGANGYRAMMAWWDLGRVRQSWHERQQLSQPLVRISGIPPLRAR